MGSVDIEQRKRKVLETVIEVYVNTACPVGSKLVSRKLRPALSPATVRNVMAQLEEQGLLQQPHTSAGRVPTDRGYRYYVDSLGDFVRLSAEDSERLLKAARSKDLEIEQFFSRVSEVLSELSRQAAFVVAPTLRRSTIKQIELLPLGVHKLLCVLVGQEAVVVSHVVDVEEPISRDEAFSLARFLNTELAGLGAMELVASLQRRLLAARESFYHLVKRSLAILETALATEPEERFFLDGAMRLFEQPEVRKDPQEAHELLRQLELQEELLQRLREDLAVEGTRVRIGREVEIEGLEGWSYILAPFSCHETVSGGVGVLGPKRMDYCRMRGLVEAMARIVTQTLSGWEYD